MKSILLFALASVLALTACQNADDVQQPDEQRVPIELKQQALAITETRAAQNLNKGYIAEGKTVAVMISSEANTKYYFTTGANGAMTAPDPRPTYPTDGSTVDITAYYPSTAGTTFTVVSDQSTDDNYLASDLMFASKTGVSKTSEPVALEFEHKLSKISVNVTAKDEITVTGITLKGVKPTVSFDTTTGAVGEASGSDDIVIATDATKGSAVIPAQTLNNTLEIVTSAGTANYTVNKTFEAGTVYTVNLTLQKTGVEATVSTANWTAGAPITIADIDDQTFSGSPITPELTVTSDGTALTANTDYDLTWANNVNAGTATVLVTGKGSYAGCFGYKTFTINQLAASISYATAAVSSSTLGEKINNPLTKTGDGTVAYTSSNTNVATVDAATGEVTVVNAGSTTITATVTPTSNSTYATTTASYTLTVNVYRGLASVTSDDIGKVICSNKHIHNDINAINCGGVARAMIAYVGNQSVCRCTNGLAYSLEDASYYDSTNKKTVYTFTYGGSTTTPSSTKWALANWSTSLNDSGFGYSIDGGTGTTGVGSAGSCVWRVPSMAEYKYMFAACGGSNYNTTTPFGSSSVSFGYGKFREKLQALGKDVAIDSYWTYQSSTSYVYYRFSYSDFKIGSASSTYRLRFILAF